MTAKELQQRNAKAENLSVLQTDDGQFFVESEKGKILYSVTFTDDQMYCTCGDWAKKSKRDPEFKCKHILAVMNSIPQRSIAWRLGIPYNYLTKCPPEIQALNLNFWLEHEKNEELFFRFDGREVRAVFTPKYKPINQLDLVMELYAMGYRPETEVQCSLDDTFMSLSIMDGERTFDVNGDRFRPGVSISNSEVGLASLSVSAFILRLVCVNGLVSKTELSASYRHVSTKILTEFPQTLEKVSVELGQQRRQLGISMESPVDDPLATIDSFNRQFQLGEKEREAVEWGWTKEAGDTMFAVVNTYTRASQYDGLAAESS